MEEEPGYRKYTFYVLILLLLYLFYRMIEPYSTYLALGVVLAMLVYPLHQRLNERIKKERVSAALITTFSILVVVIPSIFTLVALFAETITFFSNLDTGFLKETGMALYEITGQQPYALNDLKILLSDAGKYVLSIAPDLIGSVAEIACCSSP